MIKLQDLQQELVTLQAERTRISSEGEVLLDCWVAQSGAGGTARTKKHYWQVRSRNPICLASTTLTKLHSSPCPVAKRF